MPSSSLFTISILSFIIGFPTEPLRIFQLFSAQITGEVSLNPYPWTVLIPRSLNPFEINGSAGAPPDIISLSSPPRASITDLNNFLLTSIWIFLSILLIFIAFFINFVFPCLFTSFIIVLYIASTNTGTPTNNVTLYSFKFCFMYLNPSGNTVFTPHASITIIHVDPNIWWNGKNAILVSLGLMSSTFCIAYIFDTMFFCDNITAFDFDVVPDVNNNMLILLLSILTLSYSFSFCIYFEFLFFLYSFPLFIISGILKNPCSFSFIQINVQILVLLFSCIFNIWGINFWSNTMHSALLLINEFSNSSYCKSLSNGTDTIPPNWFAKCVTTQAYWFFPIIAVLLFSSPII